MNLQRWKLRNLPIQSKLILIGSLGLVFTLLIGAVSFYAQGQIQDSAEKMYDQSQTIREMGQIRTDTRATYGFLLEMLLTYDSSKKPVLEKEIDERLSNMEANIKSWEKNAVSQWEKEQVDPFRKMFTFFKDEIMNIKKINSEQGKDEALSAVFGKFAVTSDLVNEKAEEIGQYINNQADELNHSNESVYRGTIILSSIVILISFLIGGALIIPITRAIVGPVKHIQQLMDRAGSGDFTAEGTHQSLDEMGQLTNSYNTMARSLRELIGQVYHSTDLVAASSQQLSASSQETSAVTEKIVQAIEGLTKETKLQNQTINEATNTIGDMNTAMQNVMTNTLDVSEKASASVKVANEGNGIVQQASQQMNQLQNKLVQLEEVLNQLQVQTNHIGNMNAVVSNIAAQTGLLALNASIEAARAGEHGRGFAVVASEVRKLADESAQSADEINQLVSTIQKDNQNVIQTMRMVQQEFDTGINLVQHAGTQFYEIEESINSVAAHLEDVSATMEEISAGSDQMNATAFHIKSSIEQMTQNIEDVASSTEEQLASMEEVQSSSQHLAHLAEDLQQAASRFSI
ncbi:methyl-accepting chemotaxis protein [Paenibacillus aquistagni]|uniref:methyl-accepting chemotaxis protein n=1 Tax=Paenibacillus aquistagni TaxID=1852522 RepID=UPI000B505837|nr:methyl-accepting chemotaxis protein [Paenibacillus aquistagni]